MAKNPKREIAGHVDGIEKDGTVRVALGTTTEVVRAPDLDVPGWRGYRVLGLLDPVGIGLPENVAREIRRGLN